MNWEVRTMRSGTSCFNGTLYRKTMARFWPLWALYGLFWMFAIPLNLMNRYFNYLRWTGGTGTPQDLLLDLAQSIPEYLAPGVLPEGVVLTSSAGSNSQSVAEHALACLLALCRRLPQCRDQQRERLWTDPGKMKTLSGATVLVAGAGHIGSWFAGLCRGLGAHTVGLKRDVSRPVEGFDRLAVMEELDGLLPQADVVALMLPHSPQTEGLMDARRLRLMKEDAILLSMGRGSVLDQEALAAVMGEGRLWGAALDVTVPEPLPQDSPLWTIPNLIITPHSAGGMRLEVTRANCVRQALDNLNRWQAGKPLENLVRR